MSLDKTELFDSRRKYRSPLENETEQIFNTRC